MEADALRGCEEGVELDSCVVTACTLVKDDPKEDCPRGDWLWGAPEATKMVHAITRKIFMMKYCVDKYRRETRQQVRSNDTLQLIP